MEHLRSQLCSRYCAHCARAQSCHEHRASSGKIKKGEDARFEGYIAFHSKSESQNDWTYRNMLNMYMSFVGLSWLSIFAHHAQWVLKNQRRCCSPEGAIAWCKRSRTVNDDRVQTVKCSVDALRFCFNLLWFYLCILFANIVMLGLWWLPETNKAS